MGAQPQDSWLLDAQPTFGLRHGFASVSMRLFLSVVLPLTAVFVFAFVLEYRAEVRAERARLLTQESAVIQRGVRWVERELAQRLESSKSVLSGAAMLGIQKFVWNLLERCCEVGCSHHENHFSRSVRDRSPLPVESSDPFEQIHLVAVPANA